MKLATRNNGAPDGELVVVSKAADRYLVAGDRYPNLQSALDDWQAAEPFLRELDQQLKQSVGVGTPLEIGELLAPLPRAMQWLDGSVYPSHAALMDKALGIEPDKVAGRPMMYQGVSDTFYSGTEDIPFLTEEQFIDFEGEFGIITDRVPAGTSAEQARDHIKLLVQINDWSLRALAGVEMATGFGWIQAKPPCSVAPFAVTPDELSDAWKDQQVQLHLKVHWNDEQFGNAFGGTMEYGFDELVAHAAMTRTLAAGTIIGSGDGLKRELSRDWIFLYSRTPRYRNCGSWGAENRLHEVWRSRSYGGRQCRRLTFVWCHRSKGYQNGSA